jgi:hypothetical protein
MQFHLCQVKELKLVLMAHPTAQILAVNFKLEMLIQFFPFLLHLLVYLAANVLI